MPTQPNVTPVSNPTAPANNAAFPAAWTAGNGWVFRPGASGTPSGNVYGTADFTSLQTTLQGLGTSPTNVLSGTRKTVWFDFSLSSNIFTFSNGINFGANSEWKSITPDPTANTLDIDANTTQSVLPCLIESLAVNTVNGPAFANANLTERLYLIDSVLASSDSSFSLNFTSLTSEIELDGSASLGVNAINLTGSASLTVYLNDTSSIQNTAITNTGSGNISIVIQSSAATIDPSVFELTNVTVSYSPNLYPSVTPDVSFPGDSVFTDSNDMLTTIAGLFNDYVNVTITGTAVMQTNADFDVGYPWSIRGAQGNGVAAGPFAMFFPGLFDMSGSGNIPSPIDDVNMEILGSANTPWNSNGVDQIINGSNGTWSGNASAPLFNMFGSTNVTFNLDNVTIGDATNSVFGEVTSTQTWNINLSGPCLLNSNAFGQVNGTVNIIINDPAVIVANSYYSSSELHGGTGTINIISKLGIGTPTQDFTLPDQTKPYSWIAAGGIQSGNLYAAYNELDTAGGGAWTTILELEPLHNGIDSWIVVDITGTRPSNYADYFACQISKFIVTTVSSAITMNPATPALVNIISNGSGTASAQVVEISGNICVQVRDDGTHAYHYFASANVQRGA
jgi:hypothetical protein